MASNSCFLFAKVIDLLSTWHYTQLTTLLCCSSSFPTNWRNLCNKKNSEWFDFPQRDHKSSKGMWILFHISHRIKLLTEARLGGKWFCNTYSNDWRISKEHSNRILHFCSVWLPKGVLPTLCWGHRTSCPHFWVT